MKDSGAFLKEKKTKEREAAFLFADERQALETQWLGDERWKGRQGQSGTHWQELTQRNWTAVESRCLEAQARGASVIRHGDWGWWHAGLPWGDDRRWSQQCMAWSRVTWETTTRKASSRRLSEQVYSKDGDFACHESPCRTVSCHGDSRRF